MILQLFKENKKGLTCLLCPSYCNIEEENVGKCLVRKNNGKKIELINYGLITAMAVDPIEKKPFRHFMPGTKTLCFSLSCHCNLNCKFCENFKLSQSKKIEGKYFSPIDIVNVAKEKHCESVSMSYNEPILSYEFLIDVSKECHKNDLKFIIKTNAYVNKEPWKEICEVVDSINIDWKGSERSFKAITAASAYILRERIREAYNAGLHIEVSIPLYYQDDELEEEMKILGEFLSSIDKDIPCHLLRISSSYKFENFVFNTDNLERAKNILSNYMRLVHTVV